MKCYKCGRELSGDEIGLHKKLIGRGEEQFMCISCIGVYFGCTEEFLRKKIESFRRQGCLLFPTKKNI